MTVATDPRPEPAPEQSWSAETMRSALTDGDLHTWQQIVAAIKADPYGHTAVTVDEVVGGEPADGVATALSEVLMRTRAELEADERTEVARHMQVLMRRSGLDRGEFASRIGVSPADLAAYLDASVSPPATLMIRMRRLSDLPAGTDDDPRQRR